MGFGRSGVLSSQNSGLGRPSSANSSNPFGFFRNCSCVKGYASAAEAIASEEDLSGSDEVQELMEEMIREDKAVESQSRWPKKMVAGMGIIRFEEEQGGGQSEEEGGGKSEDFFINIYFC
jgi:DNA-directed RNA polymerase